MNHYGPGTTREHLAEQRLLHQSVRWDAGLQRRPDHNFGPKNGLIGGNGPNERNVVGHTLLQAVEYSHGWNRPPWGTDTKTTVPDQRQPADRQLARLQGRRQPTTKLASGETGKYDNGQTVNVYDGSNQTLVKGNYMASPQDGVQVMAPDANYNEVRNNFIGIAPNGQPAQLGHYGVSLRWQAQYEIIEGNTMPISVSPASG